MLETNFAVQLRTLRGRKIFLKRVVWLTDIHLEMLSEEQRQEFLHKVAEQKPDAVLISGDTAEHDLIGHLNNFEKHWQVPIYFVLGNHDYYYGSIADMRDSIRQLVAQSSQLCWLPEAGIIELTSSIGLIGHGAWADCRYGNYHESTVTLQDYTLIEDFQQYEKDNLLSKIRKLGDEAASYLYEILPRALEQYPHVFFVTHPPPFREATWYMNYIPSWSDEYLPHFSCKAAGDALLNIMPHFPENRLTVLCGHTHWPGRAEIQRNLLVLTGGNDYGSPQIQEVFELA